MPKPKQGHSCAVAGCGRPALARKLCRGHYDRHRRDPRAPLEPLHRPVPGIVISTRVPPEVAKALTKRAARAGMTLYVYVAKTLETQAVARKVKI